MIDKNAKPTKLLWVDLEMTGLDPVKDVILEVAAVITDFSFTTLASYQTTIRQPKELVVERMQANQWWADFPDNRDRFIQQLDQGKPPEIIEQDLLSLLKEHFVTEPAILAGNSIYNDRSFIKQWWPALNAALHYRMLDVTSFKLLFQGKYDVAYEKPEIHRAYDDIIASITELQYYLQWFQQ